MWVSKYKPIDSSHSALWPIRTVWVPIANLSTNNINNQPSYLVFLQNNYTIFTFIQSFLSFFIILVLDCPAWLFLLDDNYRTKLWGSLGCLIRGNLLDVLIRIFCCPSSRSFEVLHIGSFDVPSCFGFCIQEAMQR